MRTAAIALVIVFLMIGSALAGYVTGSGRIPSSSTITRSTTSTITLPGHNLTESITVTSTATTTQTTAGLLSGQLGPWNETVGYPAVNPPSSCVTALDDAYCVGGNGNRTYFAQVSPKGVIKWSRGNDYPIPIKDESCIQNANAIYCVGGVSNGTGSTSDPYGRVADVYHATLSASGFDLWAKTTQFPYVVVNPRCVTQSSYMYCIENGFTGTSYNGTAEAYFTTLSAAGVSSWTRTVAPPSITTGCSAIGGFIYCFGGGKCPPPTTSKYWDCFSPSYFSKLGPNGIGNWSRTTDLPTATSANYVTAGTYIYYLSIPVFYAQVSIDGIGPWRTTTNFPSSPQEGGQSGPCGSDVSYLYCTSNSGSSVYYNQVGAVTLSALVLLDPPPYPRADYVVLGECSVTVNGTSSGDPCLGPNIDGAVIFDCAASAATSTGCQATVASPTNSAYDYGVTIWYPRYNASNSETNCAYQPTRGYPVPVEGWCVSINQNSFIITEQIPMQPGQT